MQGLKVRVRLQDLGFRDYLSILMRRRGREEESRRGGGGATGGDVGGLSILMII